MVMHLCMALEKQNVQGVPQVTIAFMDGTAIGLINYICTCFNTKQCFLLLS